MAELATIARPYAEALMKVSGHDDASALSAEVTALAGVAGDAGMRLFADNPKVSTDEVVDVLTSVVGTSTGAAVGEAAKNFIRMVVENGRLAALPEIASQFAALVQQQTGTSHAVIESAFPLDGEQVVSVNDAMQARFGRKLESTVVVVPELIGGVRIVVGDEVLDTSIRARLAQMKAALTA